MFRDAVREATRSIAAAATVTSTPGSTAATAAAARITAGSMLTSALAVRIDDPGADRPQPLAHLLGRALFR